MCGEHSIALFTDSTRVGSSPHVRGALPVACDRQLGDGIIPACAGSTDTTGGANTPKRDHPRMYGEHLPTASVFHPLTGSSPHVRGALNADGADDVPSGIIPACAGSTSSSASPVPQSRDHPRMCGEHFCSTEGTAESTGSSPHVRGAPIIHVTRTV